MNKSIIYFKDPEIIRQYQNSDYTDERHYAVSKFLAVAGYMSKTCDEHKGRLLEYLITAYTSNPMNKNDINKDSINLNFDHIYCEYVNIISIILDDITVLGLNLPEDIKRVTLETTETAEYVLMLLLKL